MVNLKKTLLISSIITSALPIITIVSCNSDTQAIENAKVALEKLTTAQKTVDLIDDVNQKLPSEIAPIIQSIKALNDLIKGVILIPNDVSYTPNVIEIDDDKGEFVVEMQIKKGVDTNTLKFTVTGFKTTAQVQADVDVELAKSFEINANSKKLPSAMTPALIATLSGFPQTNNGVHFSAIPQTHNNENGTLIIILTATKGKASGTKKITIGDFKIEQIVVAKVEGTLVDDFTSIETKTSSATKVADLAAKDQRGQTIVAGLVTYKLILASRADGTNVISDFEISGAELKLSSGKTLLAGDITFVVLAELVDKKTVQSSQFILLVPPSAFAIKTVEGIPVDDFTSIETKTSSATKVADLAAKDQRGQTIAAGLVTYKLISASRADGTNVISDFEISGAELKLSSGKTLLARDITFVVSAELGNEKAFNSNEFTLVVKDSTIEQVEVEVDQADINEALTKIVVDTISGDEYELPSWMTPSLIKELDGFPQPTTNGVHFSVAIKSGSVDDVKGQLVIILTAIKNKVSEEKELTISGFDQIDEEINAAKVILDKLEDTTTKNNDKFALDVDYHDLDDFFKKTNLPPLSQDEENILSKVTIGIQRFPKGNSSQVVEFTIWKFGNEEILSSVEVTGFKSGAPHVQAEINVAKSILELLLVKVKINKKKLAVKVKYKSWEKFFEKTNLDDPIEARITALNKVDIDIEAVPYGQSSQTVMFTISKKGGIKRVVIIKVTGFKAKTKAKT